LKGDFNAVLWKEWREILVQRSSGGSSRYAPLILIGIMGILLPLRMGLDFFDPPAILLIALLSMMGVLIVSVEAFAGERERHTLETLLASRLSDRAILFGKIAASVSYGWLLSLIAFILGTITVNLANGDGRLLLFDDAASWLVLALAPPLLGTAISTAGVLVSLRAATVRQAMHTLTTAFMLAPLAIVFGVRAAPAEWKVGFAEMLGNWSPTGLAVAVAVLVLAIDLTLIAAAMARFQRSKLVAD
jgi:ABC-2 type transport system permease protein